MKLLFILGNTAVGKMTVGQELTKITPFRLFHNHMMIEPVLEIFGQYRSDVIGKLRNVVFEEFSQTDEYGLIFTFMCAFDVPADWAYLESIQRIFRLPDEAVYYVELIAPQAVRLERNTTQNRLNHKASKRDLESSAQRLIRDDQRYRCESFPGEISCQNYLRIENESITASEAAKRIAEHFHFPNA